MADLAIASEGTFGADPFGGVVPWNTELLLWVDADRGIEVAGHAQGPARSLHRMIRTLDALQQFATDAGFPDHHLVLRPEKIDHPGIHKGIHDPTHLTETFYSLRQRSASGLVSVENDLRAFCNPTRQKVIRQATDDLICKLLSGCPACGMPGFWAVRYDPGLPCASCGSETRLPIAELWHCPSCGTEDIRVVNPGKLADPVHCDICNP